MANQEVSNLKFNTDTYDLVDSQARQDIESLELDVSNGYVILKKGVTELSRVEIPNVFDAVPCSSLSASCDFTDALAGQTRQIQVVLQPVNCSQIVRYTSNNLNLATVSSTGLVSLLSNGTGTITVACGNQSSTVNVSSSKKIDLTGHLHVCNWYKNVGQDSTYPNAVGFDMDNGVSLVGSFPCDMNKLRIKPGESVYLGFDDNTVEAKFQFIKIVKASSGSQIAIVDNISVSPSRYYVNNVIEVDSVTDIHDKSQNENSQWGFWGQNTYTNNLSVDVYVLFAVKDNANYWRNSANASTEGPAWVVQHVDFIVT